MYKKTLSLCLLLLCFAFALAQQSRTCSAKAILVETAGEWQEGNTQKRVFELQIVNTHDLCSLSGSVTLKINTPAGSRMGYSWGMANSVVSGLTLAPSQTHAGPGFILSGAGTPTADIVSIETCSCPNDPTLGPSDPTDTPTAPPTGVPTVPATQAPTVAPTPRPTPAPTQTPGSLGYFNLGMKVAIFVCDKDDNNTEVRFPVAVLLNNMTGSQYTVFNQKTWGNASLTSSLWNTDGSGNFYAFLATMELSCWSSNQTGDIFNYQNQFDVKLVTLYAYPNPLNGLAVVDSKEIFSADKATLTFDPSLYPSMRSIKHDAVIPVPGGISPSTLKTYAYFTTITNSTKATPAVWININGDKHMVAAFIHYENPTRTALEFYVNQADWALYPVILGIASFEWVTNGIFAGARRVEFNLHMDDLFMFTGRYDDRIGTESDDPNDRARVVPEDLEKVMAWQKNWNENKLAAGSNFTLTMPYNYGTIEVDLKGTVDPLFTRCQQADMLHSFIWESHTYTHPYLDNLTYAQVTDEYTKNLKGALVLFNVSKFSDIPAHLYCNHSTITPSISGLYNSRALHALADMGFKFVVGDNSRHDLVPPNLYHTLHTDYDTPFPYPGVVIVPRHATNIYYMADRPDAIVQFYNRHYNATEGISDIDLIVARDVEVAVKALMAYRHDPFMFHQANMVWMTLGYPQAQEHCLLSYWTDHVLAELEVYNMLPVISRTHDQLGHMFLDRENRDACGFSATLKYDRATGAAVGLSAKAQHTCVYGVSGVQASGPNVQQYEVYGTETTTWFNMDNTTAFSVDFASPVYPINIGY